MTERPAFVVGQSGEIEGVSWRVRSGRKRPDDIVIEVRTAEWVMPKQSVGLLLLDFFCQVEDILYPHREGKGGSRYFLTAAWDTFEKGWESVAERIEREKAGRARWPRVLGLPEVRNAFNPPPYANDHDEGRLVGSFRTAITHALWCKPGATAREIAGDVREIANRLLGEGR